MRNRLMDLFGYISFDDYSSYMLELIKKYHTQIAELEQSYEVKLAQVEKEKQELELQVQELKEALEGDSNCYALKQKLDDMRNLLN